MKFAISREALLRPLSLVAALAATQCSASTTERRPRTRRPAPPMVSHPRCADPSFRSTHRGRLAVPRGPIVVAP